MSFEVVYFFGDYSVLLDHGYVVLADAFREGKFFISMGCIRRFLQVPMLRCMRARGKVFDTHTVELTTPDGEVKHFTAKHILIATGGWGCLAKYSWQGKLFLFLACKFSC
jgi:hypothetical protein